MSPRMQRTRRLSFIALLLTGLLLLSACGGGGGKKSSAQGSDTSSSSDSGTDTASSDVGSDFTDGDVKVGKTEFGPNDDDVIIQTAIDDVQSFWEDEFSKLYPGEKFAPLSGGEFPYGPTNPPPECGGTGKANYEDVAQNAFYCPAGDFVAWDTDNLTGNLLDEFGPVTLAIVVAHELGHKV